MVSEDSGRVDQPFLLIVCTGWIVTRELARTTRFSRVSSIWPDAHRTVTDAGGSNSYLRTVIVTAAVYRGFNSGLAALLLTFRHRAGVSPYTSPFGFAETCVFSKQSVGPLSCDLQALR